MRVIWHASVFACVDSVSSLPARHSASGIVYVQTLIVQLPIVML